MAFVYLIGEENDGLRYKIGCTKSDNVNKRLKTLQTGNPNKLTLVKAYQTDKPHKLESLLHTHFKGRQTLNEWFDLEDTDVDGFEALCDRYQGFIEMLKDNPYF